MLERLVLVLGDKLSTAAYKIETGSLYPCGTFIAETGNKFNRREA